MKKVFITIFIFTLGLVALNTDANAAYSLGDQQGLTNSLVESSGVPKVSLTKAVANIIRGALAVIGLLFFILTFYGGFKWMLARGNEEAIGKAKGTVTAAIIGLIIVVSAYAITTIFAKVV